MSPTFLLLRNGDLLNLATVEMVVIMPPGNEYFAEARIGTRTVARLTQEEYRHLGSWLETYCDGSGLWRL